MNFLRRYSLVMIVSLFIIFTTIPVSAQGIRVDPQKDEVDVISVINKYYEAVEKKDIDDMLKYSIDKRVEKGGNNALEFIKSTFNDSQILNYKVTSIQRVDSENYKATIQETWDITGTLPDLPYVITKENNSWKVVKEALSVDLTQNSSLNSKSSNVNGKVEKQPLDQEYEASAQISLFASVLYWNIEQLTGGKYLISNQSFSKSGGSVELKGWQEIVTTDSVYIQYRITKHVNGTDVFYGTGTVQNQVPQNGTWFSLVYSNVPDGSGYRIYFSNINNGVMKGAGNAYN
ncbi:hypothetical protein ABEW34_00375 [Paenibacillus algorifonticola]|uniref:hypothetical protein n=1 Tax=Paenibacillus algorifonticola TaxID=684063 RepID=UPI003D2A494F